MTRYLARHGDDYPLARVRDTLSSADLAFANLECPLSRNGSKASKPFCFKVPPERVRALRSGGLDLLSLANNHSMDCGRTGLVETMETLRVGGLRWCGAGATRAEAEAPAVAQIRGLRIAFVGFCDFIPEGTFLREDRPTIAFASEESVGRAVGAARRSADVLIASFHWGVEYRSRPGDRQETLARTAVEAGADLVLGHHPHVLQRLESIPRRGGRPALVAYSLGNFVFDQRGSGRDQSVILRCTLGKGGVQRAEILPVRIEDCRPRPARAAEGATILSRLAELSAERGTTIRGGEVELSPVRTP